MFTKRPFTLATGAAVLLAASGIIIPASVSYAAERIQTPLIPYDLTATAPVAPPAVQPNPLEIVPSADVSAAVSAAPVADDQIPAAASVSADADTVECMAKVVLHEAGNQSRAGKIAVAQTLVNRLNAGRFGDSICEVVNQRGQFFQISSYHPNRNSDRWQDAVEISHDVLAGEAAPVAPGAMFFHASYARANSFFRTRQRVNTVGDHIFYR